MLIMVFIYKEQASPALPGGLAPTPSPSAQEGEAGGKGSLGGGYKGVRKGAGGWAGDEIWAISGWWPLREGLGRLPTSTYSIFNHLFIQQLLIEHLVCVRQLGARMIGEGDVSLLDEG